MPADATPIWMTAFPAFLASREGSRSRNYHNYLSHSKGNNVGNDGTIAVGLRCFLRRFSCGKRFSHDFRLDQLVSVSTRPEAPSTATVKYIVK